MLSRRSLAILGLLPVAEQATAADFPVEIRDFAFVPESLAVSRGSRVVFVNHDDTPHTIVSNAEPALFRSEGLDTDDRFAWVFDKAGSYGYHCSLHPHMQGVIVVT